MFREVDQEGVAGPPPFHFDDFEGTPRRRYSSVDPMHMPCPCRGSRPALVAAVVRAFKKAGLVRGQWVFLYRYANSGQFRGG